MRVATFTPDFAMTCLPFCDVSSAPHLWKALFLLPVGHRSWMGVLDIGLALKAHVNK